jgi:hypothetical protein
MQLPHHENPVEGRDATAPYNFVPLPQAILLAEEDPDVGDPPPWRAHDRWLSGMHSGWIHL